MEPLDIARHRLSDYAQGAHAALFSQLDAVRIYNRLDQLETRYRDLLEAVIPLPTVINRVQLSGSTTNLANLIHVLDAITKELPQS
jgi:hypothetical protein